MSVSLLLLILCTNLICTAWAQQSAAGQDTLIGIVGRDFVIMGADTSSSGGGGIALTSSNIDKIAVVHDGRGVMNVDGSNIGSGCASSMESLEQQAIAVGFAGDAADGKQANHIPFAKHEKFETLIISSYAVSIICLYIMQLID